MCVALKIAIDAWRFALVLGSPRLAAGLGPLARRPITQGGKDRMCGPQQKIDNGAGVEFLSQKFCACRVYIPTADNKKFNELWSGSRFHSACGYRTGTGPPSRERQQGGST
jgi:hypothetical protein